MSRSGTFTTQKINGDSHKIEIMISGNYPHCWIFAGYRQKA